MHICELTYRLLEKFEIAVPGVDPTRLEVAGYPNEKVLEELEMLRSNGLADAIAAHDKVGKPYAGMIIGLTQAGSDLLGAWRCGQRDRNYGD
ncbi:hypothetical protein [Pseudoxanthomonas sp. UTMC 1351]|uniref:hypothetical protein n=1 Tax=Pseudoxanthomonas sp. UTMC 1351 TaxID=2695853 RepID=UPI0034CD2030